MSIGLATEHDRSGQREGHGAAGSGATPEVATPGKRVLHERDDAPDGGFGSPAPGASAAPAPTAYPGKGKSAGPITIKTAAAPGDPSTARTRLGVGEEVTFTGPGPGTWRVEGQEIGHGEAVTWTAPSTTALRNVTFEVAEDSKDRGARSSLPLMVIAPSTVAFKKLGSMPVTGPGTAGVGMILQVDVGPKDVSFGAAEWLEGPGPAEGVSGYFAEYVRSGQSLSHKPNPAWLAMGAQNDAIRDNVWTKDKPKLKHPDGTMRWWAGAFQWTIPNYYKVGGGPMTLIQHVTQRFEMDDAGAITVTKGGATASARPDNAGTDELVRFTRVADARAWLELHGIVGAFEQARSYKRQPGVDPASVRVLMAGLRAMNLSLYTYVACQNTHALLGADKVAFTANGKTADGRTKMLPGQSSEYLFKVNDVIDVEALVDGGAIPLTLVADGNQHTVALGAPFVMRTQPLGDRYTLSAHFK